MQQAATSPDAEALRKNGFREFVGGESELFVAPIGRVSDPFGPVKHGVFLTIVFDEWVRHDVGQMFVQIFDASLAAWYGAPAEVCSLAKQCGSGMILEHNGDIHSCDHFVEPDHFLGNIHTHNLADIARQPLSAITILGVPGPPRRISNCGRGLPQTRNACFQGISQVY